jgi:hypothetical protein
LQYAYIKHESTNKKAEWQARRNVFCKEIAAKVTKVAAKVSTRQVSTRQVSTRQVSK